MFRNSQSVQHQMCSEVKTHGAKFRTYSSKLFPGMMWQLLLLQQIRGQNLAFTRDPQEVFQYFLKLYYRLGTKQDSKQESQNKLSLETKFSPINALERFPGPD